MSGYKYIAHFRREFVNGILEGITIKDTCTFLSHESAKRWADNVQAKAIAENRDYRISDVHIVPNGKVLK